MSEASELIDISYSEMGIPFYNGYRTVYEALWNIESEFKALPFADRMSLSLELLSDLGNGFPPFEPRMFFYTFEDWGTGIFCSLYDSENSISPVLEWEWKDVAKKMDNLYNIKALHSILVSKGEILPDDNITLFL